MLFPDDRFRVVPSGSGNWFPHVVGEPLRSAGEPGTGSTVRYVGACRRCGQVIFIAYDVPPGREEREPLERHERGHA